MARELVIDLASPYQVDLTADDYRKVGARFPKGQLTLTQISDY